jgi:hypothetical protein
MPMGPQTVQATQLGFQMGLMPNQEPFSFEKLMERRKGHFSLMSTIMQLSNVLKKRKQKMRNHKQRKRRKVNRYKSK